MPNQQSVVLAAELLARPSVTPDDAGCMLQITDRLMPLGFVCNTFTAGVPPVTNLWARRSGARGSEARMLVFAGHTDVVPPGDPQAWRSPPFEPTVRDGRLYGRGACDMKSSIAAFVVAVEQFLQECPQPDISIALLLTSDEEGPARHGTAEVCRRLQRAQERLDWCIVGEPTCEARMGDTIKNGRRGSMNGVLSVRGQQGHVAYPDKVRNPVLLLAPALTELAAIEWDRGNGHFGPTTWQVSNIHAGTGATNVVPGAAELTFNFRFGTESTPEQLQRRLCDVLDRHGLDYTIHWEISAHPFLTQAGELVQAVSEAIREECGQAPSLSTSGGTSDGRFIARICPQVIEFGPPNASIHQVDEHVALADIVTLQSIYLRVLRRLNKLA